MTSFLFCCIPLARRKYLIVMPLIYIHYSPKHILLGLHIYLRTLYSQSKVYVIFTMFNEWNEKENGEKADYANLSTNFLKHTDIQNGEVCCREGVRNIGTIVVIIYNINLLVFYSVSPQGPIGILMLQSHIFREEEMIWKSFEKTFYLTYINHWKRSKFVAFAGNGDVSICVQKYLCLTVSISVCF